MSGQTIKPPVSKYITRLPLSPYTLHYSYHCFYFYRMVSFPITPCNGTKLEPTHKTYGVENLYVRGCVEYVGIENAGSMLCCVLREFCDFLSVSVRAGIRMRTELSLPWFYYSNKIPSFVWCVYLCINSYIGIYNTIYTHTCVYIFMWCSTLLFVDLSIRTIVKVKWETNKEFCLFREVIVLLAHK